MRSPQLRALEAICQSPGPDCDGLSADERHLAMVLAVSCNYANGAGHHGQAKLATRCGRSERWVRDVLARLSARSAGIRIVTANDQRHSLPVVPTPVTWPRPPAKSVRPTGKIGPAYRHSLPGIRDLIRDLIRNPTPALSPMDLLGW